MFTKGQLIFAGFFIVAFILFMVWSYRKDTKTLKIHYKNTALKVGFWLIIAIAIFSFVRIYIKK